MSSLCWLSTLSVARALVMSSRSVPQLVAAVDNSLKAALTPDPDSDALHPNKEPREVFGHYVEVSPSALPEPYLVAASPAMIRELGLDLDVTSSEDFIRIFSGASKWTELQPWATP